MESKKLSLAGELSVGTYNGRGYDGGDGVDYRFTCARNP